MRFMSAIRRRWVISSVLASMAVATLTPLPPGLGTVVKALGLTKSPLFRSRWPHVLFDSAQNVLLFVPLGFLLTRVFERRHSQAAWRSVAASFVLSAALEFVQLWIPGRYPSLRDLFFNVVGAALGAYFAAATRGRSGAHGALTNASADDPIAPAGN